MMQCWQVFVRSQTWSNISDIGYAIQSVAQAQGYSIVREYCGHGIGRLPRTTQYPALWPERSGHGIGKRHGLTIEPTANAGKAQVKEAMMAGQL